VFLVVPPPQTSPATFNIRRHREIKPEVEEYPLNDANRALLELKAAKIRGAKVLRM
jgi:D-arabinose 1-dehydrogenase-like Zn-dependent alcohol dehydrogenase